MRRAVVVLAIALIAPAARANGRFPATNAVVLQKDDPQSITVGTTFGMLVSRDGGGHFYWVCEQAVGYNGTFDPSYAIAKDGTIYAGTPDGLRVSRDGGCTFDTVAVEPHDDTEQELFTTGNNHVIKKQKWIDAVTLGPSDEVWVATAEGGMSNDVFRSVDGRMFYPMGLYSITTWWNALKLAPSNPQRIYVTGYEVAEGASIGPQVHVMRSDVGGGKGNWIELPVTDFTLSTKSPMVLVTAVSPTNPDIAYVRSVGADPPSGDKLYRSTNAGASWSLVLDTTDAITGVVFLQSGAVLVATTNGGVFQATDGVAFSPLPGEPQMACVAQRQDGAIFSCGANWDPDFFALGKSSGPQVGPFTKLFRFVELSGPLQCAPGTVQHDVCDLQLWPALKEQFGIKDPIVDGAPVTTPPKPSGCCDSSGSGLEAAAIVILAVGIGGLLVRRGRRKRKCCD